jgi:hypothetical protein
MKRLLAATLLCGVSMPAHAIYLQCSNFNNISGYTGTNPPVSAVVMHGNPSGRTIIYTLLDGQTVSRETQFAINDDSDTTKTEWSGGLYKCHSKWMRGSIIKRSTDYHLIYVEVLFNINSVTSMNTLLTRNEIDCGLEPNTTVPEYTQPPVPCQGRASTPLAPGRPSLWRRNARHGRLWPACSLGDIGAHGKAARPTDGLH